MNLSSEIYNALKGIDIIVLRLLCAKLLRLYHPCEWKELVEDIKTDKELNEKIKTGKPDDPDCK